MKIEFDAQELRPLIAEIVEQTLEKMRDAEAKLLDGRLTYTESEAVSMIGLTYDQMRTQRQLDRICEPSICVLTPFE